MKRILPFAVLLVSACMAPAPIVTVPQDLSGYSDRDRGTLEGSWRAEGDSNFALSIMEFGKGDMTFSARRHCTMRGGTLSRSGDVFRISGYSGFGDERCGTWTSGPTIAPFDGDQVRLSRHGLVLMATGAGKTVRFSRDRVSDLSVKPERLFGSWLLSDGKSPLSGPERTIITFAPDKVSFMGNCKSVESNGFVTLPGLIINPGGDLDIEKSTACDAGTSGDALIAARGQVTFRYLPDSDHIEARFGSRRYLFVRG